jgi:GTP-binding protein YchF
MSLKIGIVGLPNVGKSTLFNALTRQTAEAANFAFTTIEPNIGVVPVPDERLEKLAVMHKSAKIVPTSIEFVDIAGLVRGAHEGEGLGNKFLSYIREVDAIAHVVRFFDDPNVIHVDGKPDPLRDAATIETELALTDLETVERALKTAEDKVKGQDKEAIAQSAVLKKVYEKLSAGRPARETSLNPKEEELIRGISLLTRKPTLYIANVSEEQIGKADQVIREFAEKYAPSLPLEAPPLAGRSGMLPISIKIEQEIVELPDEERATFLAEYGLKETGLSRLIKASYELLGLITFLTTGPDETRAWTVQKGSFAPQAAGKIHSDLERGFIRAETVAYKDLVTAGSYAAARAAGKVRDEGKEYVVKDGDIMIIKFSV